MGKYPIILCVLRILIIRTLIVIYNRENSDDGILVKALTSLTAKDDLIGVEIGTSLSNMRKKKRLFAGFVCL